MIPVEMKTVLLKLSSMTRSNELIWDQVGDNAYAIHKSKASYVIKVVPATEKQAGFFRVEFSLMRAGLLPPISSVFTVLPDEESDFALLNELWKLIVLTPFRISDSLNDALDDRF